MKSFESDIKKYAEKTRLKVLEREAIRERLLSYMEYHPLKKDVPDFAHLSSLKASYVYIPFNALWTKVASGALALILIVGVPLLAERAVPGDVLYLVKTGVNEGIRTQLASSPYEKVALETRLIERRIAEARLLASEGRLTEEVEAQIAETVKGHADAVQSGIAELREDSEDEAALAEIVFNSTLEVQSAVLDQSEEVGSSSVASILDVVNTVRDEVATDANPITPSYDGLLARVESETTRAYELSVSIKKSATPEESGDIDRRLSDIDRYIVEAKELYITDETGGLGKMVDALGLIQKLITFMTDIDVREAVTLESIVPVSLTDEERTVHIETVKSEINTSIGIVEVKVPYIESEAIREKVTAGLDGVRALVASLEAALLSGDIDTAEAEATEAQAFTADLLALTEGITALEKASEEMIVSTTTPPVSENGDTNGGVAEDVVTEEVVAE